MHYLTFLKNTMKETIIQVLKEHALVHMARISRTDLLTQFFRKAYDLINNDTRLPLEDIFYSQNNWISKNKNKKMSMSTLQPILKKESWEIHLKVYTFSIHLTGFSDGSVVKNLLPVEETRETQAWPLGWNDHLKEEMATHSSMYAGKS